LFVIFSVGGDPNIRYFHSYWALSDTEALIIEATPHCQFWNFQLSNHWMESLEYRYFPIHANSFTCPPRKDGKIRIVVSHSNPNSSSHFVGRWCSTVNHHQGCMCLRWVHPHPEYDGENLPLPSCQVVPFVQLSDSQWAWETSN
jgi:hypothetical protein